jgi:hypothetical protein
VAKGRKKIRFVKVKLPGLYSKALEKGWSLLFGFFFTICSLPKTWSDKIKPCKKIGGRENRLVGKLGNNNLCTHAAKTSGNGYLWGLCWGLQATLFGSKARKNLIT